MIPRIEKSKPFYSHRFFNEHDVFLAAKQNNLVILKSFLNFPPQEEYFHYNPRYSMSRPIDMVNIDGETLLHLAAENGHENLVKFLLCQGASPHREDYKGLTPLHVAANRGYLPIVEFLLEHKVNVNSVDYNGYTPLHLASYNDHDIVSEKLVLSGANLNLKNKWGETPLSWACKNNNSYLSKLFLDHGADVDFVYLDTKETLLHWSSYYGDISLTKIFLSKGLDIHATDENGDTPLHIAALHGGQEIVEFLLMQGADVNFKNKNGETPLYAIIPYNKKNIVKLLIAAGAHINEPFDFELGNDIQFVWRKNSTPLHWAVSKGYHDIVVLLLSKNAELDVVDEKGFTPLSLANFYGRDTILNLLISHGANMIFADEALGQAYWNLNIAVNHDRMLAVKEFLEQLNLNQMTEVETLFEPLRRGGKMNYLLEIARAVFETGWDLFIEKSISIAMCATLADMQGATNGGMNLDHHVYHIETMFEFFGIGRNMDMDKQRNCFTIQQMKKLGFFSDHYC